MTEHVVRGKKPEGADAFSLRTFFHRRASRCGTRVSAGDAAKSAGKNTKPEREGIRGSNGNVHGSSASTA